MGIALGSTWIFMGGPDFLALGADDMLNELAEKKLIIDEDYNNKKEEILKIL